MREGEPGSAEDLPLENEQVTRRSFLKKAAVAGASGLLVGRVGGDITKQFHEEDPVIEIPDVELVDREKTVSKLLKYFSTERPVAHAERIEHAVVPENPVGCIVLMRQIHDHPANRIRSQTDMDRNPWGEGDHPDSRPEQMRKVQTSIFSITSNLVKDFNIKDVYAEGFTEEQAAEKMYDHIDLAKREWSHANDQIDLLDPLAQRSQIECNIDEYRRFIKGVENGAPLPGGFKNVDEMRNTLHIYEANLAYNKSGWDADIKKNISWAQDLLEDYRDRQGYAQEKSDIKTILAILKGGAGDAARMRRASLLAKRDSAKERMQSLETTTGAYLALGPLIKNGRVEIQPTEKESLIEAAVESSKSGLNNSDIIFNQRENFSVQLITRRKPVIAPLIFGGAHRDGFKRAVQEHNKAHPEAQYALVTITPQGYSAKK